MTRLTARELIELRDHFRDAETDDRKVAERNMKVVVAIEELLTCRLERRQ